jgi:hypothetical protein
MVTVIGFSKKKNAKGEEFNVLQLEGEVEMLRSVSTGKFYAHARHASITSTLSEIACKCQVGRKFPGKIEKVEAEAYQYQIPGTNETITLTHSYQYSAEPASVEEAIFEKEMT